MAYRSFLSGREAECINPATIYIVFSRRAPVCCKAAKRRWSPPPASFANTVSRPARGGLSSKRSNWQGFQEQAGAALQLSPIEQTIACKLCLALACS